MEETVLDVLADTNRLLVEQNKNLERIAAALESLVNDAARCAHGATGLCMSCVIQNDLMRPPAVRR